MANQAWAENAVIIQDSGSAVRWKPRCPYCGYIPLNKNFGGSASKGVRSNHSASCDKCRKSFNVVISRG